MRRVRMPRPLILFSAQWIDVPLEELVLKASEWGYQGLELSCGGDHFEVRRAQGEDDYCQGKLALFARHDLSVPVLSQHRVGQAVGDIIDAWHQGLVPEHVRGDGKPQGVQQRAVEEMTATVRAAQKLGVSVVGGFTTAPVWGRGLDYAASAAE